MMNTSVLSFLAMLTGLSLGGIINLINFCYGYNMEDEYKDDDITNSELQGIWKVIDYTHHNMLKPAFRGFLFGIGHYLTYKVLGGYISSRVKQFN